MQWKTFFSSLRSYLIYNYYLITPLLLPGKILNKNTYKFSPRRFLDLYLAATLPNIYIAHIRAVDIIIFANANHKKYYNKSYQLLYIKIRDLAMLKLHKGYLIFSFFQVTTKLI